MFSNNVATEIKEKYQSGERSFQNLQLRNIDLRGIDLSQADLRGTDLTGANLRDANLSGSNLENAYLNEADLTGTNLQGACLKNASLIKTYLNKANLAETDLQQALLTNAYATKANFSHANLKGAFLNGAKLSGAILMGVKYDNTTHFDATFNPHKTEMVKAAMPQPSSPTPTSQTKESGESAIAEANSEPILKVADLLVTFNHLSDLSRHYLGNTMTLRYWNSTRPDFPWLQQFKFDHTSVQVNFEGDRDEELTALQLQWAREWVKGFAKVCSQIIQDYPKMIDRSQVIFTLASSRPNTPPSQPRSYGNFQIVSTAQLV